MTDHAGNGASERHRMVRTLGRGDFVERVLREADARQLGISISGVSKMLMQSLSS